MALYGHSFTLAADDTHGLGATTKGGGKPGLFTNEAGLYSFYEVRPYDEDLLVPDLRINVVESFENGNYRLWYIAEKRGRGSKQIDALVLLVNS